ncbi:MAG: elongation factor P [bacterium]
MDISNLNVGTIFLWKGEPYKVLFREHSKMGRGGAVLRTKLKNLRTGSTQEETFKAGDKFEDANVSAKKMQYLYKDENYNFMDLESFEQVSVSDEIVGGVGKYLVEGMEADIMFLSNQPLDINIPVKMNFKVVEAPPSIKGNTADGGSKQVVLENGLKVSVPLFIKEGDILKINTQTGEYVERA